MTLTTVVIPDVQLPYHSPLALRKILRVIEDIQPDAVFQIGDLIDMPQPSRWSKGSSGEFTGTLQKHITQTKEEFFQPLRAAAPKAKISWLEGNHDLRITDYISKYAPALAPLSALSMENIFGLDEFNVQYVKGPVRVATNTLAIHGHEPGGYSAMPQAWDLKFLRRYGTEKNVIFGHTHQPFLTTTAHGHSGKVKPRWIMNVGSIMNPEDAHYVHDGSVSWTPSFAILRDDGKRTFPELVTMNSGFFYCGGVRY